MSREADASCRASKSVWTEDSAVRDPRMSRSGDKILRVNPSIARCRDMSLCRRRQASQARILDGKPARASVRRDKRCGSDCRIGHGSTMIAEALVQAATKLLGEQRTFWFWRRARKACCKPTKQGFLGEPYLCLPLGGVAGNSERWSGAELTSAVAETHTM